MPEKSFSEKCQKCPDHTRVCFGCLNQVSTFDTIRDFLVKMEDQWLVHKFELAVKDVIEYKKHIVRAVHQDRAKADLMERLSTEEVLLIFDYAMKFLPQKFREAQTDFFAKKGDLISIVKKSKFPLQQCDTHTLTLLVQMDYYVRLPIQLYSIHYCTT